MLGGFLGQLISHTLFAAVYKTCGKKSPMTSAQFYMEAKTTFLHISTFPEIKFELSSVRDQQVFLHKTNLIACMSF